MLVSDDDALIAGLILVGEIFGTLVQYADDLRDAASQPNPALALPELLRFLPCDTPQEPARIAAAFWSYLYPIYVQAAMDALGCYPGLQGQVAALFAEVFGPSGQTTSP